MTITLNTNLPATGDLIIPITETDELASKLADLAAKVGLAASVLQHDFKAEANETLALYGADGTRAYLLGLGKDPQVMTWLKTIRKFFFNQKQKLPAQLGIDLTAFDSHVLEAVVLGVRGGATTLNSTKPINPTAPNFTATPGNSRCTYRQSRKHLRKGH